MDDTYSILGAYHKEPRSASEHINIFNDVWLNGIIDSSGLMFRNCRRWNWDN